MSTTNGHSMIGIEGNKLDDRAPETLTEDERMKRYLGRKFVIEALAPLATGGSFVGRCPAYADEPASCVAQAREMMAQGKDITQVRIRDTRTWKIVAVENR